MADHRVADTRLADFGRREVAVGRRLRTFAVCTALALAVPGVADPNAEFAAAFTAYQETMEASRYVEAVAHAEKARELGEKIYDDAKVTATLAFNQEVPLRPEVRGWRGGGRGGRHEQDRVRNRPLTRAGTARAIGRSRPALVSCASLSGQATP